MNATELSLLSSETTAALGWTLLHFVWQGALIGLGALLVLRLMRDADARTRYLASALALMTCALMPILTFLSLREAAMTPVLLSAADLESSNFSSGESFAPMRWWEIARAQFHALMPILVSLWAGIAALLMVRLAGGLLWVQRLRDDSNAPLPAALQRRAAALAQRLGLRGEIPVRVSAQGISPLAVGVFKPMVLIPAAVLLRLPAEALEALIAHELAHVRRHDYLVNLLQSFVEAVLFYHPVVWWLSNRLRDERELIADDLAAEALGDRRGLAMALNELDKLRLPEVAYAPAAQGGQLMSRIQHLLRPRHPMVARSILALPLIALLGLSLTVYAFAREREQRALTGVVAGIADQGKRSASTSDTVAVVPAKQGSILMSGELDDIDQIQRAQKKESADFIWFRKAGRIYAVRDPAIVEQVRGFWKTADAHERSMTAAQERMQQHEARLEALSQKQDRLSELAGDDHQIEAAMDRLSALAEQQADIATQQAELMAERDPAGSATELRAQDRQLASLQKKLDSLQAQMTQQEEELESISLEFQSRQQPLQALSREMELASQPMEAIGKEMEAIGKRIEADAVRAERQTRVLLEQAIAEGKAQPLD